MTPDELSNHPHLRPVRIRRSALGPEVPCRDLIVSPQHRIVVRSRIVTRMFGAGDVLVAAKHLTQMEGIDIAEDLLSVVYVHFLFDDHQIVFADGAEAESLFTGTQALSSLGADSLAEVLELFPELRNEAASIPARPLIGGRRGRSMADRHRRNHVDLVMTP